MTVITEPQIVTNSEHSKLTGKMGVVSLALTVLAFSAPLTTVSGYIPFAFSFGGIATPMAFVIVTAMVLLFSISYITLNSEVKRPGDFYSFISFGLGKEAGLGSGLMAATSYFLILTGVAVFFGVSCAELHKEVSGEAFSWYWYTSACWLTVAILGYLHVELSAKVLTWVMISEIVVCVLFAFAVLKGGGDSTMTTSVVFSPTQLFNPDIKLSLAMLFAVSFFLGFEATALFRDEVRTPEKTIPMATYGSIIFIGCIYTLCAYAMVIAYGNDVQGVATGSPATMFSNAFADVITGKYHFLVSVLVLTSSFAATLAIHNVLSRYFYNLGTDGALPEFLRKVHPIHSSPYKASSVVSLLVLVVLMTFILLEANPDILYGQLTGVGTSGLIILLTLVNFSVLRWFFKHGRLDNASVFKTLVAPTLSSVFFIGLVLMVSMNFELLVGGAPGDRIWMLYGLVSVGVFGIGLALYYKKFKIKTYNNLGRTHH